MDNPHSTFTGGRQISFAGACVMSVIFLAVGSAMLFYACKFYARERAFLAHATHTQGTIVTFVQREGSHQSIDYSPVFTFADSTGQVRRVTSATSNGRPAYAVGATVPVLYDPERPEQAQLDTFASAWELVLVLGGFGAATLLGSILGWRHALRRRRNDKELPRDPTILSAS